MPHAVALRSFPDWNCQCRLICAFNQTCLSVYVCVCVQNQSEAQIVLSTKQIENQNKGKGLNICCELNRFKCKSDLFSSNYFSNRILIIILIIIEIEIIFSFISLVMIFIHGLISHWLRCASHEAYDKCGTSLSEWICWLCVPVDFSTNDNSSNLKLKFGFEISNENTQKVWAALVVAVLFTLYVHTNCFISFLFSVCKVIRDWLIENFDLIDSVWI